MIEREFLREYNLFQEWVPCQGLRELPVPDKFVLEGRDAFNLIKAALRQTGMHLNLRWGEQFYDASFEVTVSPQRVEIFAPSQRMGQIIGKHGATVERLRGAFGCPVKVTGSPQPPARR